MSDPRCWRCERKLFEVEVAAGVVIPAGITIRKNCERCGALNNVPLDTLHAAAIA